MGISNFPSIFSNVIFPPYFPPPLLMLSVPSILHSAAGTIQLCWYYSAFVWLSAPSILHVSNMLLVCTIASLLLSAPSILHGAAGTIPRHPILHVSHMLMVWYYFASLLLSVPSILHGAAGTIPLFSGHPHHLF
jgi:hypothetical protein